MLESTRKEASMAEVKAGDMVSIHYTGSLEDGTEFSTSRGGEELKFNAGSSEVIQGIAAGVIGMEVGDTRRVTVSPEEGFGEWKPGLEQVIPRQKLPEGIEEGDAVKADLGEHQITFWVMELTDETAVLDANHPLAGKTLTFDIELISVDLDA